MNRLFQIPLLLFLHLALLANTLFAEQFTASEPLLFQDVHKVELVAHTKIQGYGVDFSGLTHISKEDRYLVIDDACHLVELEIDGIHIQAKRKIELTHLEDCEAVAYLPSDDLTAGEYRIALTEERRGNLIFTTVSKESDVIDCTRECSTVFVDHVQTPWRKNSGLEALTVNTNAEPFIYYIGKEEKPRHLYVGVIKDNVLQRIPSWDAELAFKKQSDIAGMAYFKNRLIVLDERTDTVREVDPKKGHTLSEFSLPKRWLYPRYEGIALVARNEKIEMVISAERNHVLVFHITMSS